jgi:hypothetical protein
MARSLFVIFSLAILLLFALLFASIVENDNLTKQTQSQTILLDSLQSECAIKDITIGRDEFIIEQLKEKYPTEIKKIDDETE